MIAHRHVQARGWKLTYSSSSGISFPRYKCEISDVTTSRQYHTAAAVPPGPMITEPKQMSMVALNHETVEMPIRMMSPTLKTSHARLAMMKISMSRRNWLKLNSWIESVVIPRCGIKTCPRETVGDLKHMYIVLRCAILAMAQVAR